MNTNRLNIRKAEQVDIDKLAALSIQVFLDTYALDGVDAALSGYVLDNFSTEKYRNMLLMQSKKLLVAEKAEGLNGLLIADTNSFYRDLPDYGFEIERLYVSRHFMGRGIGRSLISAVMEDLSSEVWLSVWCGNSNALGFYRHIGFRDVGTKEFHIGGQVHQNIVLSTAKDA